MHTIPFSQLADLTAWLALIDRQIVNDDGVVSTVYELYRRPSGRVVLVSYRQDFSGSALWGEFGSAEEVWSRLPSRVAELVRWNVRRIN